MYNLLIFNVLCMYFNKILTLELAELTFTQLFTSKRMRPQFPTWSHNSVDSNIVIIDTYMCITFKLYYIFLNICFAKVPTPSCR